MRKLRKFSVFALFFILFATAAWGFFSAGLRELGVNLLTGGGLGTCFAPAEGEDGNVYIVRSRGEGRLELYGLDGPERVSRRELADDLPEDYEVQNLYISEGGDVLLSLYTRQGARLVEYGLYASVEGGPFQTLVSEPLEGAAGSAKRRSAGLLEAQSRGGQIVLTMLQDGAYTQYAFSPQGEQGLQVLEELNASQAEELESELQQRQAEAESLAEESGFDLDRATDLVPDGQGGALLCLDGSALYRISADGAAEDLSAGLYGRRWQSGLILLAALLGVTALSCGCCYFVCEARKLYFPLVIKNLLVLALAGYLAVHAAVCYVVEPGLRSAVEAEVREALLSRAQAAESWDLSGLTQLGAAYEDVELALLAPSESGWTVEDSTMAPWRTGGIPGLQDRARQAAAGETVFFAGADRGDPVYLVYVSSANGDLIEIRMNARAFEQELQSQIRLICRFALAAVGFIVVLAAVILSGVSRGTKRAIRGIGLIAQGADQVRVVQQSGDELEALAAAVNDLSAQGEELQRAGIFRSETYLRFVPQRLVALLGVSDIKQVDKNTTASHEMAVMAVRFVIPQTVYQRGPQALFDDINEVFSYVARPVSSAGGAIYSFTYDGFDAVFEEGIQTAVGAAVAVRQALLDLNTQREVRRLDKVKLRVALDYGSVLIGVVGDEDRVVPTIVSDSLHTVRRLTSLAPMLDANILCTALVADAAGDYALRYIGKCRENGRDLRVYEIYDGDDFETRQAKESSRAIFSAGVYAFYSGDFTQAKKQFMEIAWRPGEDGAALHYLYLADQYEKQPPDKISLG